MLCLTDIKDSFSKSKEFAQFLNKLDLNGKILAVLDGSDESVTRTSRNIHSFHIMRAQDVNGYDGIRNKKLLVTKEAVQRLLERIKK